MSSNVLLQEWYSAFMCSQKKAKFENSVANYEKEIYLYWTLQKLSFVKFYRILLSVS